MQILFKPQYRSAGRVRPVILVTALVAVLLGVLVLRSASPLRQIEKKQAALLEGIEKRSRGRVEKLIAESYRDRWEFDKDDVVTAFLDVGSQFMILAIQAVDAETAIGDGKASVTSRLQISGSGSPVAQLVIRRANQLKDPFVFHWKKQSWWPGSWRLVEVDNGDLPDDLDGYEPGDIRRAMSMD